MFRFVYMVAESFARFDIYIYGSDVVAGAGGRSIYLEWWWE